MEPLPLIEFEFFLHLKFTGLPRHEAFVISRNYVGMTSLFVSMERKPNFNKMKAPSVSKMRFCLAPTIEYVTFTL